MNVYGRSIDKNLDTEHHPGYRLYHKMIEVDIDGEKQRMLIFVKVQKSYVPGNGLSDTTFADIVRCLSHVLCVCLIESKLSS